MALPDTFTSAGDAVADGLGFVPGEAVLLSTDSPGRDEDPFVLRARDGFVYVAWYSERNDSGDILLRRTRDGVAWSEPVQVSATADTDFYPSLWQDEGGGFHATFFRRVGSRGGRGHIVYTHSLDPMHWESATEVDVTAPVGAENDWTPSISQAPGGQLVIAFARDRCFPTQQPCFSLAVTTSADGVAWTAPSAMVDPAGAQDHLPFLLRVGPTLTALWNRYPADATLPYLSPTTDILYATSVDGVAWTTPVAITANGTAAVVDVFPTGFLDHDGSARVAWLRASGSAQQILEGPIAGASAGSEMRALPATGYSHHLVATGTPGVYLGAWTAGAEPTQDIFVRVFSR